MFETPAFAQAAAGAPAGGAVGLIAFVPYIAIFAIFYFLMIRPQQKRAKAQRDLIGAATKGDTVVTAGGVIGKIVRVMDAEGEVEIEIAPNVKVRVVKAMLADVRNKPLPAAANDVKG
ncbi:preprotein translocase subunit YajC [Sandarakinorhabdus sp. DWP1-3-1]|uniref:preprotein translocase subunit YajC n=1 Tax=Sandarakinorhabdus sp. DWP1-3-1 TaxID=2804627 RepID=UPI003CFABDD4